MRELVRGPVGTMLLALSFIALIAAACGGSSATQTPASSGAGAPTSAAETTASPETSASEATQAAETPSASGEAPTESAAAQGGGAAPDPATLVSADMAASVIGGSPKKVDIPGMANLPLKVVAYSNDAGDTVSIFVEQVPGGQSAAGMQAAMAMAGAQGDIVPVSGVGDAAGKVVEGSNAVLAFVKAGTIVVIGADSSSGSGTDLEPKVESLAKQVSDKL